MRYEEFIYEKPVFSTREFASAMKISVDAASRKLKTMVKNGVIQKVTRAVWINDKNPTFSPYGLTAYLLGAEQGYVSFLSALHRHGVISQIPQKIFVATTGHGRSLNSKVAFFEFLQLNPSYMRTGIDWFSGGVSYGLASAEKALIDCLYLATRKGKKFRSFPELDFSKIRKKEFIRLVKHHNFPKAIQTSILNRFDRLAATAFNSHL